MYDSGLKTTLNMPAKFKSNPQKVTHTNPAAFLWRICRQVGIIKRRLYINLQEDLGRLRKVRNLSCIAGCFVDTAC